MHIEKKIFSIYFLFYYSQDADGAEDDEADDTQEKGEETYFDRVQKQVGRVSHLVIIIILTCNMI